jgi:hypothetical protein
MRLVDPAKMGSKMVHYEAPTFKGGQLRNPLSESFLGSKMGS